MPIRTEIPPTLGKDADPTKLWSFLEDNIFDPNTPIRVQIRRMLNRVRLYRENKQQLDLIAETDEGFGSADWKPLQQESPNDIPLPVQNELFPVVTREAALLVGVGSRPYIRPSSNDHRVEDGAKLAKDVLVSHLEDISWADDERIGSMHQATYGTWFAVSYMDFDWTKTTRQPIETAVGCPECDTMLASPEISEEDAMASGKMPPGTFSARELTKTKSTNPLVPDAFEYRATHCPTCTEHPEMAMLDQYDEGSGLPSIDDMGRPLPQVPAQVMSPGPPRLVPKLPAEGEYEGDQTDYLGRPLGEDLPDGEARMETMSPYDAYPNPNSSGIDVTPTTWEEFGWEVPRSLDYIRKHYPLNGWEVTAEDSSEIFRRHPIVGGLYGGLALAAPNAFQDHALLRIWVQKPKMEKKKDEAGEETIARNHGRLVVMANKILLHDGDFEVESQDHPGRYVPLMHFDWCSWEHRDRMAYGLGMVEIGSGQQDIINTSLSQTLDAQFRGGNPKWLAEEGVEFAYKGGMNSDYPSDFLIYRRSDPTTQAPPEPFKGMTISEAVPNMMEQQTDALQRTLMTREVEGGGPPGGGITAYSALLLMVQKAAEGRKPRVERTRDMKKRLYKHQLQLIAEFTREDRLYHYRGRNNRQSVKSFKGIDLRDQCEVRFEDEPVIDVGIARREAIAQGINLGTIAADTAASKRKINKELEIPNDINDDPNQQVEFAIEEAIRWTDDGVDPIIDQHEHSHPIHWQQHAVDLGSDEWRERKDRCKWGLVLLTIWGWDEEFKAMLLQEMLWKAAPPLKPNEGLKDTMGGAEEFIAAENQYYQQMAVWGEIQKMPKPIELRVMQVWEKKLAAAGFQPPMDDPDALKDFKKVFRFEAHAHGHRILARMDEEKAQMGAAIPAPAGAGATSTGMIPAEGQTAAPPPGGTAGEGSLPSPGGAA